MRTAEQNRDKKLCASFRFLLIHYLFETEQIDASFIGFDSNAFCYSPSKDKPYFKPEKRENWKCAESQSGFYSPLCREWYKLQKAHPDKATMGDLYSYAGGDDFGLTFCVPLKKRNTFHAALCYDIKITE